MVGNKKIVILSFHNFPFGGASANYLRNFSLGLSQLKNDILVILPKGIEYNTKGEANNEKEGVIEDVKYKHLNFTDHPKNIIAKILAKFFGYISPLVYFSKLKNRKGVDLLVTYDVSITKTLVVLACKLILRKKLVIIIPDYFEKPVALFSFKAMKWYNFYLGLRYLSKYADGFIFFSNYFKKYFHETLNCKKDILIIPNLIDPSHFENITVEPYIKDKITIGYIGTPISKDGINDLIKSFSLLNKKYNNTHLMVIGDDKGEKSLLPALKEFAKKYDVLNNITFTGLVPLNEVPELLNSCQIFALTRPSGLSAEAGFPMKLGEYFACRKPVVMTNVGDVKIYFKDKEHLIIVEPDNIESISRGFEFLINNQNLFAKITDNAYTWMNNNINYKIGAKRVDDFLEKFI